MVHVISQIFYDNIIYINNNNNNNNNNNIISYFNWVAISQRLLLRPQYPTHSLTHAVLNQFKLFGGCSRSSSQLFPGWWQGGAGKKTPNGT